MERLHFADSGYNALEASIHLARYMPARSLCPGARVLDIACGEGYGAEFLSRWGAKSVLGIDVSNEAVEAARSHFSRPTVAFEGRDILKSPLSETFDLIVSLETIEHVDDPHAFLVGLQRLLDPSGNIIVSCPNDHWYYRNGGGNPHHKTRWSFEEFRALAEGVLGPASNWSLGSFCVGFASSSWPAPPTANGQIAMRDSVFLGQAAMVPPQPDLAVTPENASYFLGVWGPAIPSRELCAFAVSMDQAERFWGDDVGRLQARVAQLEAERARSALRGWTHWLRRPRTRRDRR